MDEDTMRTFKTLYGIIFVLMWSVVGWITARHGKNMTDL